MVLRRALEIARKRKVILINPANDAETPAQEHFAAKSLTADEARRLLDALPRHPFGAFYLLMLGLGLRPGEVRGLKWADIVFPDEKQDRSAGAWVTVRRQVQRVEGTQCELPVKTKKGNRRVALPGFVAYALMRHRERQNEEIARAQEAGVELPAQWADLVFQNAEGNPVEERHVVRCFHELTDSLNLPHLRLYDLRRTYVTFLHAMGVPVGVIRDVAGHSQISVTMDYYTDTLDTSREAAARAMLWTPLSGRLLKRCRKAHKTAALPVRKGKAGSSRFSQAARLDGLFLHHRTPIRPP